MAGRSGLRATGEQRAALVEMATGRDRAEADRARAILLTLDGWTSPRIAEAFGVRDDTVRLWRLDFAPVKAEAALREGEPLLLAPVADRTNWTLARFAPRSGSAKASRCPARNCQRCCGKGGHRFRRPRHTPEGRQDAEAVERAGPQLQLRKAQPSAGHPPELRSEGTLSSSARAGDIALLFADESEALTHP